MLTRYEFPVSIMIADNRKNDLRYGCSLLLFQLSACIVLCLIKFPHAFAQTTHQFRNFTAAKKKQDNDCDNQNFIETKTHNCRLSDKKLYKITNLFRITFL